MNRLLVRVFLVSIAAAFVGFAVMLGCSSGEKSQLGPRETGSMRAAPTASSGAGAIAGGSVATGAGGGGSGFGRAGGGIGGAGSSAAGAAPSDAMDFALATDEELWVIEKNPSPGQRPAAAQAPGSTVTSSRATGSSTTGLRGAHAPTSAPARPRQAQVQSGQAPAIAPDITEEMIPGTGQLVARLPDKLVPVPLKHTDVKAAIAGYVATVDVTQQYHNPYAEKIEAIYVFPLPSNAAVNEFVMTIGERKIRGIIREREQARQIYEAAKRQGHVASLLQQERPNIFTQSVANIEPGKQIDVNIKYFHTLEYADGWYEYHFPMVVGPRFNPPGSTDGIGARPRDAASAGSTGQPTEVPYLRPNERSGHDISLALEIDAGVRVEEIKSVNHKVELQQPGESKAQVKLASGDQIPNKDFVLRYKVAGKTVKSALMAQKDDKNGEGGKDGGYFTLMLFPPESLQDLPRKPLELIFTLDVSGSMSGKPIEQAKAAVTYALKNMREDDTFNVIRFAGSAEQMAPSSVPANAKNVKAALKYIQSMEAGGGTMMIDGIRKSLQVTPEPDRLRFVAFLTDGYIGNESEILKEVHNLLGPTRIFSFGVGSSVNRFLLDHMARMGQGCATYLSLNADGGKVMEDYFQRISHPALTDISLDFGSMQVSDVYPSKLPDLFVGRPVVITGRYSGSPEAATVKVKGNVGGEAREMTVNVNASDAANQHKGIAPVWARAKISELGDRATYDATVDLAGGIKATALEYGLMSAYTSFVAIDSSVRTAGEHGTTVAVPVPMPEGVRYETTVPEGPQ